MNHLASAFGIGVLIYLGFIAVAPTPIDTIDRMCSPGFQWPKKVLVAGAKIFSPSSVGWLDENFDAGFGRCRVWVWGVLYEDEYQATLKKRGDGK